MVGRIQGTRRALSSSIALGLAIVSAATHVSSTPASVGRVAPPEASDFVASSTCRSCHSATHSSWTSGRHSKMLQDVSPASIIPAFDRSITLRGKDYKVEREGDSYFVVERYLQQEPVRRRVDYTLGSRRVQHYLSRMPDGRIVVLPPSYDVEKKEWFHNLDIVDLEESGETKVQVWNTNCFGCHVSGQAKGFDPVTKSYATTWTDNGTACERCHGPGRAHVNRYQAIEAGRASSDGPSMIVHPARLSAESSTALCAQCHTLRDITQPGYVGGADYFDHFTPLLEYAQKRNRDPAYWADGRPRRFSNDAIGFWQSQCFFKGGATCVQCHEDVHEPDIEKNSTVAKTQTSLCASCHPAIARDGAAHSRHGATSGAPNQNGTSPSCVSCHMPRTVISLRHRMPDHTISVPAPANTEAYGIPNACNECHKDRSPQWAEGKIQEWFPKSNRRSRLVEQAAAFDGAVKKSPGALRGLIAIASDETRPPIVRANALGHLRSYDDPASTQALLTAARAKHPVMRTAALLSLLERGASNDVQAAMLAGLHDARRSVRMAAALGAAASGLALQLKGVDRAAFDRATRDHSSRASFMNDDANAQTEMAKLAILSGDFASAEVRARAAKSLSTAAGGDYFLALARLGQGHKDEAVSLLRSIPPNDAQRGAAEALLAKLLPGSN